MEMLQTSKRVLFKCTWPGCGREYSTCPAVEKHVRLDHLGYVVHIKLLSQYTEIASCHSLCVNYKRNINTV